MTQKRWRMLMRCINNSDYKKSTPDFGMESAISTLNIRQKHGKRFLNAMMCRKWVPTIRDRCLHSPIAQWARPVDPTTRRLFQTRTCQNGQSQNEFASSHVATIDQVWTPRVWKTKKIIGKKSSFFCPNAISTPKTCWNTWMRNLFHSWWSDYAPNTTARIRIHFTSIELQFSSRKGVHHQSKPTNGDSGIAEAFGNSSKPCRQRKFPRTAGEAS